jgi:hypothetical protein
MRYCYHNKLYLNSGAAHGIFCDPVRWPDGKCMAYGGKQLVRFQDGALAVVIRRCLRLREKCKTHRGETHDQ